MNLWYNITTTTKKHCAAAENMLYGVSSTICVAKLQWTSEQGVAEIIQFELNKFRMQKHTQINGYQDC